MNDVNKGDRGLGRLWRWATTKPQVYAVYVAALILVWAISFYAGTLNPKKSGGQSPPPVTAPQR